MLKKRMLMIRGSGPPNIKEDSFRNETYFLLAKGFIDCGIFDEVVMLYLNSQTPKVNNYNLHKNIKLIQSPVNDVLKGQYFDFVFVRAEFQEYPICLKTIKYKKLGFHSATSYVFPRVLDSKKINIIYVNERKDIIYARKNYPWIKARIIDKPVDEKTFFPKKLRKKYDICCVANFRPRKHYTMLFEAINKLPYHRDLKIIWIGNLFMSEYDAQMLAGEYDLNVTYTNLVSLKEVANYLRQSKFNVLASKLEANPRALYESLACNIPILVNAELTGGLHLINKYTGIKMKLWKFDKAIDYMLKNYQKFEPYKFFKKELTVKKIIKRLAVDFKD